MELICYSLWKHTYLSNIRESSALEGYHLLNRVTDAQKRHLTAGILYPWDSICIIITYDEMQASRLLDDMMFSVRIKLYIFRPGKLCFIMLPPLAVR